ncbi:MAG: hypothetical protein V3W41_11340 [Planctomycetota bacterium]
MGTMTNQFYGRILVPVMLIGAIAYFMVLFVIRATGECSSGIGDAMLINGAYRVETLEIVEAVLENCVVEARDNGLRTSKELEGFLESGRFRTGFMPNRGWDHEIGIRPRDLNGNPFRVFIRTESWPIVVTVISAGRDCEFGTDDDISLSESF